MNRNDFVIEIEKLGLKLTDEISKKLENYYNLLTEWNEKFNLTTILEENQVYLKHFYDSMCLVKSGLINNDTKTLCDFGSGAGFPGLVIKIFFENIDVTLIESNTKKCQFLNEVIKKLELENVTIINERTEIYGKINRELFDVVTCRAVSSLRIIAELGVPLTKVGGHFIPLKSSIEEEIKESEDIINKTGSKIENIITYFLPIENSKRNLVVIKKIKKTDSLYPREYNKIKNRTFQI